MNDVERDRLKDRWNDHLVAVYQMAERARADPEYLAGLDLELQKSDAPNVAIIRGCAKKMLPDSYRWSIEQTMGGRVYVLLQGLVENEDGPRDHSGA